MAIGSRETRCVWWYYSTALRSGAAARTDAFEMSLRSRDKHLAVVEALTWQPRACVCHAPPHPTDAYACIYNRRTDTPLVCQCVRSL